MLCVPPLHTHTQTHTHCARLLSPPHTGVTCTGFTKTVKQEGWIGNILDTVIPDATVSPAAGRSNYRKNPTWSLQPSWRREQVPTGARAAGLATKVDLGWEREEARITSCPDPHCRRRLHARAQAAPETLPRCDHRKRPHVADTSSPWLQTQAVKTPTAKEC